MSLDALDAMQRGEQREQQLQALHRALGEVQGVLAAAEAELGAAQEAARPRELQQLAQLADLLEGAALDEAAGGDDGTGAGAVLWQARALQGRMRDVLRQRAQLASEATTTARKEWCSVSSWR